MGVGAFSGTVWPAGKATVRCLRGQQPNSRTERRRRTSRRSSRSSRSWSRGGGGGCSRSYQSDSGRSSEWWMLCKASQRPKGEAATVSGTGRPDWAQISRTGPVALDFLRPGDSSARLACLQCLQSHFVDNSSLTLSTLSSIYCPSIVYRLPSIIYHLSSVVPHSRLPSKPSANP